MFRRRLTWNPVKAQRGIINAHGCRAGFHQALFKEHLLKAMTEKGITEAAYKALP